MSERLLKVRILNAKGHEEVAVGVEEAIQLCATQMTTGNKWARLINTDGTTDIQTDVTFFTGDVRDTMNRLENVSEIWMIAALRGGSPFRVGSKSWRLASEASKKGWETRRRRDAKAKLQHRTEQAFCKARHAAKQPQNLCSGTSFSSLRKPAVVNACSGQQAQPQGQCAASRGQGQKITYKVNFSTNVHDPIVAVRPNKVTVNLLYGKDMIVEALHAFCLALEGPIHKLLQGNLTVRAF